MTPQRIGGLTLFVIGAIILVFGLNATHKVADSVNESFTGRYTDKTMWYIIGGAALVLVGAGLTLRGAGKTRVA
jgi:Protein of unknown function (DUF3185)